MKRMTGQLSLSILLALAVAISVGLTPTAWAQGKYDDPVVAVQPLAAPQAQIYWSEERRRNAIPMLLHRVSGPSPQVPGTFTPSGPSVMANAGGPGDLPLETRTDSPRSLLEVAPLFGTAPFSFTRYRIFPDSQSTYRLFPYKMTGRLFFTIPGSGDFVCSASSLNSTNRSVVWTAGHCVYTPGVGFHTNFLFAPGRRGGANLFGTWTAKAAFTLLGWQSGILEYDHGALVMNLGGRANQRVGDTLGFLGFLANSQRQQHWHVHGYPGAPRDLASTPPGAQFDGEHHEICAATWAADDQPSGLPLGPPTIGVGCDQTGGTSGGPWVVDFSGVTGATNLLNGNNSYRYQGPNPPENLKLFGPYFSTGAINLRDAAQVVPVP